MKIKKRPVEIKRDEWEEGNNSPYANTVQLLLTVRYTAYDLVRSFAHLGGAILAVDVESWDQNNDVSWTRPDYSMIKADTRSSILSRLAWPR